MATPTVVSAQLLSWVLWVLVWAAALLLVFIVMMLNLAARLIARAFAPKTGR